MNLNFTSIKSQKLLDGKTVYYRDAYGTDEFWGFWRYNKQALCDQGIKVIKEQDDTGKSIYKIRQLLEKPIDKYIPIKTTPYLMERKAKLRPYQVAPCEAMITSQISNNVSIDASDTGAGKTYMGLGMALEMNLRPGIVCTKTGIVDWKRVCQYYGIKPLFICNWESIRSNKFPYCNRKKDPFSGKWHYTWSIPRRDNTIVFFDEVHRAGGKDTQNQQIVLSAMHLRTHVMSATLGDKMAKLKTIGILIGLFTEETFPDWLRAQGLILDSKNNWKSLDEKGDLLKIHKIIFPNFGARLNKHEIPGFPDVQNIARLFPITAGSANNQNKEFTKIMEQIKELKTKAGVGNNRLALMTRYRQLAEHKKVNLLCDLVKEYERDGYSVAIFVNFDETLKAVMKKLNITCCVHGGQTGVRGAEERRKHLDNFQANKVRKIALNIKAGGTGVNLHDVHGGHPRVSIICPTWDAIELVQVLGRIHRDGAKTKAMNVLAYAAGTIEERVYERVKEKIDNIHALNDGDLADFEFKEVA